MIDPADVPTMIDARRGSQRGAVGERREHAGVERPAGDTAGAEHQPDPTARSRWATVLLVLTPLAGR